MSAIGGMRVTETVEGLERYPVNLRYPRELRDDPDRLARVLIPTPPGRRYRWARSPTSAAPRRAGDQERRGSRPTPGYTSI